MITMETKKLNEEERRKIIEEVYEKFGSEDPIYETIEEEILQYVMSETEKRLQWKRQ